MTKTNLDFPDKWFGHSLCFSCPVCQNGSAHSKERRTFFQLCCTIEKRWVSNERPPIQVCAKVNACTFFFFFFCWNAKTWEKPFSVHLPKVGEWKQHGMNAGPQSAVSGMCWREPETRPNPHSRLKRTEARAFMSKSACSCTITPENCSCCSNYRRMVWRVMWYRLLLYIKLGCTQ